MYVVQLKSKKIFSVQTIARTITKGTSTDLERLRAIWIWLCNNIGQFSSLSLLQHLYELYALIPFLNAKQTPFFFRSIYLELYILQFLTIETKS